MTIGQIFIVVMRILMVQKTMWRQSSTNRRDTQQLAGDNFHPTLS